MKITFNRINFGNKTNIYKLGKNTVNEHLDDNNILTRRIEYDEFNRDIDSKTYNKLGEITSHQHKEYYETATETGCIETFKNNSQEYIRKTYTRIKDGFRHNIDDFKSKTNPKSNYINEFIYDISDKLIKIINNGKVIKL